MSKPRRRMMIAIAVSLIMVCLNIIMVSSGNAEMVYAKIDQDMSGYR